MLHAGDRELLFQLNFCVAVDVMLTLAFFLPLIDRGA
jgi:hypothetical protein